MPEGEPYRLTTTEIANVAIAAINGNTLAHSPLALYGTLLELSHDPDSARNIVEAGNVGGDLSHYLTGFVLGVASSPIRDIENKADVFRQVAEAIDARRRAVSGDGRVFITKTLKLFEKNLFTKAVFHDGDNDLYEHIHWLRQQTLDVTPINRKERQRDLRHIHWMRIINQTDRMFSGAISRGIWQIKEIDDSVNRTANYS
jgi:hypothetical protein